MEILKRVGIALLTLTGRFVLFMVVLTILTSVIAHFKAESYGNGEKPSGFFCVLAIVDREAPVVKDNVELLGFESLPDFKRVHPKSSIIFQEGEYQFQLGEYERIRVTSRKVSAKHYGIEMIYSHDDGEMTHRYDVIDGNVQPRYFELFHHVHMFMALPFALVLSIVLFKMGRWFCKTRFKVRPSFLTHNHLV
jgi:hypothetical protein